MVWNQPEKSLELAHFIGGQAGLGRYEAATQKRACMIRFIILVIGILTILVIPASSQEVVVTGFPTGVAGSVGPEFFKPYYGRLQAVADSLQKYPLARAVITGGADGDRYRRGNDAMNPALALGRAHALRSLLITEFHVDSTQIVVRTEDVKEKGERYRYASVRVSSEIQKLGARLDTIEDRPPIEKHFTEVREVPNEITEVLGLQLSAGLSSSPFGGLPIVSSALVWDNTLFVEAMVGHTFWNGSFAFEGADLDTKRRLVGGQIVVYPWENRPVGIVVGWVRVEEISQDYYKYVKMSEGPVLGLRASPNDFISITAAYNPSKQRQAGIDSAESKNDQFLLRLTVHRLFGGGK